MEKLITDEQTLVSASTRFGNPIPVYDDGFGKLYIHRDSMGISGIVRAMSWADAYGICEDEFFPDADEDAILKAYEDMTEDEQACWDEKYGFRPNGMKDQKEPLSYLYAKDLNGDYLDELTPTLLKELEITLEIKDSE